MKLIIGNKNYSSWSLRAWLLLQTFKLPFEEILIPLDTPTTTQQIRRYSKAERVPVLLDGDLVIWDSLAICEYVSETWLSGRAWPADPAARAQARCAAAEMHSGFAALRNQMPMNCRAVGRKVATTPELSRDIQRIDELWNDMRLAHGGSGHWLCGDFGIVDCMFAPVVFRFNTYGVQLSEVSQSYMKNVMKLASMQQWLADARAESAVIDADEAGSQ